MNMNVSAKQQLRDFIDKALASHADRGAYTDDEPLFSSIEFDVDLVDSIAAIEALVDSRALA